MNPWTPEEIELGQQIFLELFPRSKPEDFMRQLPCGTLPATSAIPLKAARYALRRLDACEKCGSSETAFLVSEVNTEPITVICGQCGATRGPSLRQRILALADVFERHDECCEPMPNIQVARMIRHAVTNMQDLSRPFFQLKE